MEHFAVLCAHRNFRRKISCQKCLYTEFTVHVDDVVKSSNTRTIGTDIAIVEPGGAVRLPNGRVLRDIIHGYGVWPVMNGRYVLFLWYVPNADCYRLMKSWDVDGPYAQAMADEDVNRARSGVSRYNGMDSVGFIAVVKASLP